MNILFILTRYVQIWSSVMADVEWNKKEELVADQALKHLRCFTALFQAHTQNARSELHLIVKVQEFCYDNMNFMKVFQKIVLLFYKSKCPKMVTEFMCLPIAFLICIVFMIF